ncbi:thermostable hemolysin [Pseudomaricurvus sp. HS19]|uniref:thermostable hemolysin n=1 Tax=Pseudomaricurvus sp. HS19 TaxID=2692626 RepID=UPI00136CF62F|nr:thermostable hemolysin [Pseudomaricurvus sp. HS19]MYM64914.1 thermostable hemolysin [Pseudomaricurvus sp. HS19]
MVAMTESGQTARMPEGRPAAAPQALPDFVLHDADSPQRQQCEHYITSQYSTVYGARLKAFLPQLLSMSRDGELQACVGLRAGAETPLFLEHYLDMPVEQAIAAVCRRPVNRHSIVEIGNLVSTQGGGSLLLFLLMAESLEKAGFQWLVFTATPQVEKLVKRLGVEPCFIASADGERLGAQLQDWGSYYRSRPNVMAVNITSALQAVREHELLGRILEQHGASSDRLGRELRPVRWQEAHA